jgi:hypothetical protein
MVEFSPDAKHVLAAGQLIAISWMVVGEFSVRQVAPPSDVAASTPLTPPAWHTLAEAQLIAFSRLAQEAE